MRRGYMSKERIPIIDRPLTSDEINEMMFEMMKERKRQKVESCQQYFESCQQYFFSYGKKSDEREPILDRPLTSDEIDERMFRLLQERQRQKAESRQQYFFSWGKKSDEREPILDRPLTSDEIDERMFRIFQENARQKAESRQQYFESCQQYFFSCGKKSGEREPILDRPLTSDEINEMMKERKRRQEGSSGFWGATGPIGLSSEPTKQNSQPSNSKQF